MVVLDTAALLRWTLDPAHLSPAACQAIDRADQLVVSSISIWEIALKVKRRKLDLPLPVAEYARRLQRLDQLEILPVDVRVGVKQLSSCIAALWLSHVSLTDR